jgi:hypothetical protein
MPYIKRQAVKSGKVVSLDDYRIKLGRQLKSTDAASGIVLPPADRLWELLDRNISIRVWREQTCNKVS